MAGEYKIKVEDEKLDGGNGPKVGDVREGIVMPMLSYDHPEIFHVELRKRNLLNIAFFIMESQFFIMLANFFIMLAQISKIDFLTPRPSTTSLATQQHRDATRHVFLTCQTE